MDKDSCDKISPFRPFPHLKVISMAGLLPDSNAPVIWRGPLKMVAIRQFLQDVDRGPLDFLIVDSPPGTGDEPLSVAQLLPEADGAVIVTTLQEVALPDSRKCVNFAKKLNLPVLGIVENMSGMRCPHCDGHIPLFSQGGGKTAAKELDVPFLGALPIAPDMAESCDRGHPYVLVEEENELKNTLAEIMKRLVEAVVKSEAPHCRTGMQAEYCIGSKQEEGMTGNNGTGPLWLGASPGRGGAGGGGGGMGGGRGRGGGGGCAGGGRGSGRGGGGAGWGGGRGRGGMGTGAGPGGDCICPSCGTVAAHQPGIPCFDQDCPNCGARMVRK